MGTATDRPAALPDRCDALIVGGGAAGLALAVHLAGSGFRHRAVVVVEDGSRPLADRAWAYWSDSDAMADAASARAFDRFWVRSDGGAHLVELDRFRYRAVAGRDLDRAADAALLGAPRFARVSGRVTEIHDGPDHASVVVDGHAVRADWVFDSVGIRDPSVPGAPPPTRAARPGHSLVFTGRRIETDVDTFDPAAPTLMDFRTRQGRDLAFVYVLPSTPRVALVEHARFTAAVGDASGIGQTALDAYLREVLRVGNHRVLATERGTIPLVTARPPRPGRRVVLIGTPAGMVKASTGYGLARIQRHSAALARSLATHGHPFDVPRSRARHRALDAVLLEAIRREPTHVITAFTRLFVANPGDRVLAFLDERTTRAQELATILTLPPAPFLRAVASLATRPWAGPRSPHR